MCTRKVKYCPLVKVQLLQLVVCLSFVHSLSCMMQSQTYANALARRILVMQFKGKLGNVPAEILVDSGTGKHWC